MSALEPKLKQPVKIEFNQQKLEEHILAVETKYKDFIVTEQNLADAAKDRASVNKLSKQIRSAFTQVKKDALAPLLPLDGKVKAACDRLNTIYESITSQESVFENERREKERKALEYIVDQIVTHLGINAEFEGLIIVKENHLNKTANRKKVIAELEAEADKALVLQASSIQAEKVKAEKTKMIGEYCAMYSEKHSLTTPLRSIDFADLIDSDITEMQVSIEKAAISSQENQKPEYASLPAAVSEVSVTSNQIPARKIKTENSIDSLDIRIFANSQQRIALTDFMREAGIKFELITKKAA